MKILDFLSSKEITIDSKGTNKKEVITELVELLYKSKKIKDKDKVIKALIDREKLGSTGIGQGIAIPHCKSEDVKDIHAAFAVSKNGIDFNALDGELVYLIFLFIAPTNSSGLHLKALAKISHLLKDKYFRIALREAKDIDEVINVIKEEDSY